MRTTGPHAVLDHRCRFEPILVDRTAVCTGSANSLSLPSGYDGGDCCECTCDPTAEYECGHGLHGGYSCVDPSASCFEGSVEAGTKTTVDVSANAFDNRQGPDSDGVGCGQDGCEPVLSRDGNSYDTESRWSCAQKIVPVGEACEIGFTFEDPQDIVELQVAFWKVDQRSRTLEVRSMAEFQLHGVEKWSKI